MFNRLKTFVVEKTEKIKTDIRTKVSQDKFRFIKEGFDLDLTYITPRMIAMGTPASSRDIKSAWRNDIKEVQRFIRRYHDHHCLVINATESTTYPPTSFEHFLHFPWRDHHTPPLMMLLVKETNFFFLR